MLNIICLHQYKSLVVYFKNLFSINFYFKFNRSLIFHQFFFNYLLGPLICIHELSASFPSHYIASFNQSQRIKCFFAIWILNQAPKRFLKQLRDTNSVQLYSVSRNDCEKFCSEDNLSNPGKKPNTNNLWSVKRLTISNDIVCLFFKWYLFSISCKFMSPFIFPLK